jgi:hypothetical protein
MTDEPKTGDDAGQEEFGDASDDHARAQLCWAVGLALANFSRIEESLATAFGTAAGIASIETAFRVHDSIREFRFRLDGTDQAIRAWHQKLRTADKAELETEWNALYRIIKEDSEDRNRIAHFSLMYEERQDDTRVWYVCPYFQLFSHWSAMQGMDKWRVPDGVRKFDMNTMEAKVNRFRGTRERLDKFINWMLGSGARLPE